jgi:opacity protein-like surface antigen
MSRSASVVAILALAGGAATASVAAQQLPHATAGIAAGITSPRAAYHSDNLGEGFNNGWQGMVFLEFRDSKRPLGVRVDVVIGENPANDAYNADLGATAKMRWFGGDLDLIYHIGRSFKGVSPYVLAGGGSYRITLSSKSAGIADADQSENKFGWNAGAGVTLPLSMASVFVEARYFSISNINNAFISSGMAPFLALVAGVRFGH